MRAAAARDLEQAQRGRSERICFEPRARCQGVAREMPVTSAEVTCDSDSVYNARKNPLELSFRLFHAWTYTHPPLNHVCFHLLRI